MDEIGFQITSLLQLTPTIKNCSKTQQGQTQSFENLGHARARSYQQSTPNKMPDAGVERLTRTSQPKWWHNPLSEHFWEDDDEEDLPQQTAFGKASLLDTPFPYQDPAIDAKSSTDMTSTASRRLQSSAVSSNLGSESDLSELPVLPWPHMRVGEGLVLGFDVLSESQGGWDARQRERYPYSISREEFIQEGIYEDSSCHGVQLTHHNLKCYKCNIEPRGFQLGAELKSHTNLHHPGTLVVWVCADTSEDGSALADCEHCNVFTQYDSHYNALFHLRLRHSNTAAKKTPEEGSDIEGGDARVPDRPSMDKLRTWLKVFQVNIHGMPLDPANRKYWSFKTPEIAGYEETRRTEAGSKKSFASSLHGNYFLNSLSAPMKPINPLTAGTKDSDPTDTAGQDLEAVIDAK